MTINLKSTQIWLLAMFAAAAPIYWIPSTPIGAVLLFKSALMIAILIVCTLIAATGPPQLKSSELSLITLVGCLCAFLYLTGRLHGDHDTAFNETYSYILTLIYITVLACSLKPEDLDNIGTPIIVSFSIYPALSIAIIYIGLGMAPDIQVPRELLVANPNAYDLVDYGLRGNGLGGSRTGWGVASAVAGGILLCFIGTRSLARSACFYAISAVTLAALVTSGARGATASFLVGALLIHYRISSKLKTAAVAAISILVLTVWYTSLEADSRFRFATPSVSQHGVLDRFTSDRYSTWVSGIKNFLQNPLTGAGSEASRSQIGLDVHNAWIGLAETGGIITLAIGLAILAVILAAAIRSHARGAPELSGPIVIALASSMIEPGFPFGSFFLSVAFWLILILALKNSDLKHTHRSNDT